MSGNREEGNEGAPRIPRRTFLAGLGAGTLAIMGSGVIPLRALRSASPAAPGPWSTSFVVFGDFGSGNWLPGPVYNNGMPNPFAAAVAAAVKELMPPDSGGYIVSVGDQTYIPYRFHSPPPFSTPTPCPSPAPTPTPVPTPTPLPTPTPDCECNTSDHDQYTPAYCVEAYDEAIGQFYAAYILFPAGSMSSYVSQGASQMNFYAILGDHDWWHQPRTRVFEPCYGMDCATFDPSQKEPPKQSQNRYEIGSISGAEGSYDFSGYMQYFGNQGAAGSSGNPRYWDAVRGDIHWFALSSDANEVLLGTLANAYYFPSSGAMSPFASTFGEDNLKNSEQGKWLQSATAASTSRWRFVMTHYPPFSSSSNEGGLDGHPSATYMQWGYENLGVDAVFSGHVHAYERLYANGVMYVVSGAGGTFESLARYHGKLQESLSRVQEKYGFLAAEERTGVMLFRYYAVANASGDFPEYEICDQFAFLKQGALTDPSEILSQQGILVTQAGGTLAPTGDVSLGSVLLGIGPLVILGNNSVMLTERCKNFDGHLTVESATLRIQYRNALSAGVALTLKKGTFDVRGLRQRFDVPLDIDGGGTLVVNRKSRLIFPGSRSAKWTNRLVIEGNPGPKSLRFGSNENGLRPNQLAKIRFGSRKGKRARIDEKGYILPVT